MSELQVFLYLFGHEVLLCEQKLRRSVQNAEISTFETDSGSMGAFVVAPVSIQGMTVHHIVRFAVI